MPYDQNNLYGCLFLLGFVISVILIIYLRKKLKLVIAIFKSAADFVLEESIILLLPVASFLLLIGFTLYWVKTAVYLYSAFEVQTKDGKHKNLYLAFFSFGYIWIFTFLFYLNYLIMASTTCIWYFRPRYDQRMRTT